MNEILPLPEPIIINTKCDCDNNLNYTDITYDIPVYKIQDNNYFISFSNPKTTTVLLPNIVYNIAKTFIIYKNFVQNAIIIKSQNGDTIDNEVSIELNNKGERILLTSAFNNWVIT
jgi:hypothetical protein